MFLIKKTALSSNKEISTSPVKWPFSVSSESLTEKRKVLDTIAKKLVEVETLEQAEYNELITASGIIPKRKEII